MNKIRLYPTVLQRKTLCEWFNTSRFVWNKTLGGVLYQKDKVNKLSLRNKYVTKITKKTERNPYVQDWELNTPKTIRQQAVFDLYKAYKTCFSQMRTGLITKFNVGFKSKRNKITSIGIEKDGIKYDKKTKSIRLFPSFTGEGCNIRIGKRQSQKQITISKDCRLSYDGSNFFICVPEPYEVTPSSSEKTISLDPGTRCFLTGYDPENKIIEFHRNDKKIENLKSKISLLQSLRDKEICKVKRQKTSRVRKKLKNCVTDLHWKTVLYLVKNYKNILLPNFESQKVSMKSQNKILNRDLNIFSHYLFKQRLYYKAKQYKVKVFDVNEAYTSKTCSSCGLINKNLGSNKTFSCDSCKIVMDRDHNGARNILLKYLQ